MISSPLPPLSAPAHPPIASEFKLGQTTSPALTHQLNSYSFNEFAASLTSEERSLVLDQSYLNSTFRLRDVTTSLDLSSAEVIHSRVALKNRLTVGVSETRVKKNWTDDETLLLVWSAHILSHRHCMEAEDLPDEVWVSVTRLIPFKSRENCKLRWLHLKKNTLAAVPWTPEEDDYLASVIKSKGVSGNKWNDIAKDLYECGASKSFRKGKQCRERWNNHLDPEMKRGEWSEEEDLLLMELSLIHGSKWSQIAKQLKERTENAVKNRYKSLLRKYEKEQRHAGTSSKRASSHAKTLAAEDFDPILEEEQPQQSQKQAVEEQEDEGGYSLLADLWKAESVIARLREKVGLLANVAGSYSSKNAASTAMCASSTTPDSSEQETVVAETFSDVMGLTAAQLQVSAARTKVDALSATSSPSGSPFWMNNNNNCMSPSSTALMRQLNKLTIEESTTPVSDNAKRRRSAFYEADSNMRKLDSIQKQRKITANKCGDDFHDDQATRTPSKKEPAEAALSAGPVNQFCSGGSAKRGGEDKESLGVILRNQEQFFQGLFKGFPSSGSLTPQMGGSSSHSIDEEMSQFDGVQILIHPQSHRKAFTTQQQNHHHQSHSAVTLKYSGPQKSAFRKFSSFIQHEKSPASPGLVEADGIHNSICRGDSISSDIIPSFSSLAEPETQPQIPTPILDDQQSIENDLTNQLFTSTQSQPSS